MKRRNKVGALDTLLALPSDPTGILRTLLVSRRIPPFLLTIPIALFLTFVLPAIIEQNHRGLRPFDSEAAYAIVLTAGVTFTAFTLFATVLYRVLALEISALKVVANTLYALAALIPFMVAFYLTNFIACGELTILTYFTTGVIKNGDWVVPLYPKVAKVALLGAALVYASGIRVLGSTSPLSSYLLTVLCVPLIVGAFAVAVTIANSIYPYTGLEVLRFFEWVVLQS